MGSNNDVSEGNRFLPRTDFPALFATLEKSGCKNYFDRLIALPASFTLVHRIARALIQYYTLTVAERAQIFLDYFDVMSTMFFTKPQFTCNWSPRGNWFSGRAPHNRVIM